MASWWWKNDGKFKDEVSWEQVGSWYNLMLLLYSLTLQLWCCWHFYLFFIKLDFFIVNLKGFYLFLILLLILIVTLHERNIEILTWYVNDWFVLDFRNAILFNLLICRLILTHLVHSSLILVFFLDWHLLCLYWLYYI